MGKRHTWTPQQDALLGTEADPHIAQRLGVHHYVVSARRRKLGIGAWRYNEGMNSARENDLISGFKGCAEMNRLREQYQASLGRVPDVEIVEQAGVSKQTVRKWRRQKDIAPCGVAGAKVKQWTSETEKLLGTMPDNKLAKQLDIPRGTVISRRLALGIPPYAKWVKGRPGRFVIDGQKVRTRRLQLGLRYNQASDFNVTRKGHLAKIESGAIATVMPETLQWLCEVLQCKPEDITSME